MLVLLSGVGVRGILVTVQKKMRRGNSIRLHGLSVAREMYRSNSVVRYVHAFREGA